tara:strand:+ start:158 stop:283 length:126 start_codon:yes stop_codon:yes gene_type:complete
MYTEMGWIDKHTDWSSLTPEDLTKIKMEKPYVLGDIIKIKQ